MVLENDDYERLCPQRFGPGINDALPFRFTANDDNFVILLEWKFDEDFTEPLYEWKIDSK